MAEPRIEFVYGPGLDKVVVDGIRESVHRRAVARAAKRPMRQRVRMAWRILRGRV